MMSVFLNPCGGACHETWAGMGRMQARPVCCCAGVCSPKALCFATVDSVWLSSGGAVNCTTEACVLTRPAGCLVGTPKGKLAGVEDLWS